MLKSIFFLAVWLFLLFAGRSAMLRDPGTFWHVAAGQRLLATGQVLRDDPFSFTFAGRPWVDDQWLAEGGMAAVHRLAGWDGLLLLTATLLAAVYAWIAARLLRSGLHWLPTGLLLAVVLLVGSPQFHVRPLVATLVLLGVTFAGLVDVEAGRKPLRRLWWFVPMFIVWTNLHGGVLAGIGTIGLCAAGWCVTSPLRKNARWGGSCTATPETPVTEIIILLAALAATALVNPYGLDLPREWLETLTMPLPTLIDEHRRLDLASPVGWATVLLAVGYLAVLISVLPERLRITSLLPLVWFVLAMLRVRNAPLFGVVAVIALADMLPHSRVGKWLERRGMLASERPPAGWLPPLLPLAAVALAIVLHVAGIAAPVVGRGWARFDPARWPVELLPQLERINRSNVEGTPIFNDLNFGGFLIYHAPRMRVFIDDRCSLYGVDFLQAYDRARRENPAELDRWQRQYGFRYALVEPGGKFDRHLAGSAGWSLVARTPVATLYQWPLGISPRAR